MDSIRIRTSATVLCELAPYIKPENFWRNVLKGDDCWQWQASKDKDGYGIFRISTPQGRKQLRASRVAYYLAHGEEIPPEILCCHTCDNPSCVRPGHLWPGTNAENLRDMSMKGRRAGVGWKNKGWKNGAYRGENHHSARLSDEEAREIRRQRASGVSRQELALRYRVTTVSIANIERGLHRFKNLT